MKLVIQIPCLNEAATLAATLADLPRSLPAVARSHGVDHVIRFRRHRGLAAAFMAGIDASLKAGADLIVNTDGDNQYAGREIPRLVAPLLAGEADIVIGDRNIRDLRHMSWPRKWLQRVGSWV